MKKIKILLLSLFLFSLLSFFAIHFVSADSPTPVQELLRLITIVRPEYPQDIEEFWEFNSITSETIKQDIPGIKPGMVYEVQNHRLCPDGVDIGILYHVHISAGPTTDTFLLRGRIGPINCEVWKSQGDGDVNRDGKVNEKDLLIVMVNKVKKPYGPGDCNKDGIVDIIDLKIVYSNFEPLSLAIPTAGKTATTWGKVKIMGVR